MSKNWFIFVVGCIVLCVMLLLNLDAKPPSATRRQHAAVTAANASQLVEEEEGLRTSRSSNPVATMSSARQLGVLTSGLGWWYQCTTLQFHLGVDDSLFAPSPPQGGDPGNDDEARLYTLLEVLIDAGRASVGGPRRSYPPPPRPTSNISSSNESTVQARSSEQFCSTNYAFHFIPPPDVILPDRRDWAFLESSAVAAATAATDMSSSNRFLLLLQTLLSCFCTPFPSCCSPNTVSSPVWTLWFKLTFVPSYLHLFQHHGQVYEELMAKFQDIWKHLLLLQGKKEKVVEKMVELVAMLSAHIPDVSVTCSNIALDSAPWCSSLRTDGMNIWLLSSTGGAENEEIPLVVATQQQAQTPPAGGWVTTPAVDVKRDDGNYHSSAPTPPAASTSPISDATDNATASNRVLVVAADELSNSTDPPMRQEIGNSNSPPLGVRDVLRRRPFLRNLSLERVRSIFAAASPPEIFPQLPHKQQQKSRKIDRRHILSAEDERMIENVKWRPFAGLEQKEGGPLVFSDATDVDAAEENEKSTTRRSAGTPATSYASSFFFNYVNTTYPVQLALFRDASASPYKYDNNATTAAVPGFHLCLYGPLRNISATLPSILSNLVETMRPERIHVVTSDSGHEDFLPQDSFITLYDMPTRRGQKPIPRRVNNATAKEVQAAREAYFRYNLGVFDSLGVSLSSFLSVPDGLPLKLNGCKVCRGPFSKEMCRVAIASDMKRLQRTAELVFVTRPDAVPRAPVYLEAYPDESDGDDGSVEAADDDRAGVPLGHYRHYLSSKEERSKRSKEGKGITISPPLLRYRIYSTPGFSIVPDRGMAPAAMGVINDFNLSRSTVVVHTRVTFSLDLSWIADPVLLGHWSILQHWLKQFSVMTSSPSTTPWRETIAGERNQFAFFSTYIRPLFHLRSQLLAAASSSSGSGGGLVSVHVFDFMITLFRNVPAIDKHLFDLPLNYAAYQEMTINRKHPTKFFRAGCMKYTFHQQYDGVASFYDQKSVATTFWGAIGRLTFRPRPMWQCQVINAAPALPTCFPQFDLATVPTTFKGKRIVLPCTPFCNVLSILHPEGLCLFVGTKEHRSKHYAALSLSPMTRNYETGEVTRFNVVFPQKVFRAGGASEAGPTTTNMTTTALGDGVAVVEKVFPQFRGSTPMPYFLRRESGGS